MDLKLSESAERKTPDHVGLNHASYRCVIPTFARRSRSMIYI